MVMTQLCRDTVRREPRNPKGSEENLEKQYPGNPQIPPSATPRMETPVTEPKRCSKGRHGRRRTEAVAPVSKRSNRKTHVRHVGRIKESVGPLGATQSDRGNDVDSIAYMRRWDEAEREGPHIRHRHR